MVGNSREASENWQPCCEHLQVQLGRSVKSREVVGQVRKWECAKTRPQIPVDDTCIVALKRDQLFVFVTLSLQYLLCPDTKTTDVPRGRRHLHLQVNKSPRLAVFVVLLRTRPTQTFYPL
jgi:hypothetical protein